jgi:hypothetical protein
MRPLRGALWSIGRFGGSSGVGAQAHVGAGQVGVVGKDGGVLVVSARILGGTANVALAHARASLGAIMVGGNVWQVLEGKTAPIVGGAS